MFIRDEEREIMDIEAEIRCLTSNLSASSSDIGDWKIIKCYEAKLMNKEEPYNLAELMEKRQAARDRINELQTKLEALRAKSN